MYDTICARLRTMEIVLVILDGIFSLEGLHVSVEELHSFRKPLPRRETRCVDRWATTNSFSYGEGPVPKEVLGRAIEKRECSTMLHTQALCELIAQTDFRGVSRQFSLLSTAPPTSADIVARLCRISLYGNVQYKYLFF